MEIPKREDYELTFETQGVGFLIQDIVADFYMSEGFLLTVEGNTIKNHTSKLKMESMNDFGERESLNSVRQRIEEFKKNILLWTGDEAKLLKEKPTKESVEKFFNILGEITKAYEYFDMNYWDTVYEKSHSDKNAQEKIELIQNYKNGGRDAVNIIFFDGNKLIEILAAISKDFSVPVTDLEQYSRSEILELFDGKRVEEEILNKRRKAYISVIKGFGKNTFYIGEEALEFIKEFESSHQEKFASTEFLKGKTANKGKLVRGKARIISRDYTNVKKMYKEMDEMEQGEVLVTQTTDPEMMPALRKASATVTDIGGMLSHTAITSRELGIPCIVDTKNASKILKTGDMVEVDTEKGTVKILK